MARNASSSQHCVAHKRRGNAIGEVRMASNIKRNTSKVILYECTVAFGAVGRGAVARSSHFLFSFQGF